MRRGPPQALTPLPGSHPPGGLPALLPSPDSALPTMLGSPRSIVVRRRALLGNRRDLILVPALLGRGSDACSHAPFATAAYGLDYRPISAGPAADSDAEFHRFGPRAGASARSVARGAAPTTCPASSPSPRRPGRERWDLSIGCPAGSPLPVPAEGVMVGCHANQRGEHLYVRGTGFSGLSASRRAAGISIWPPPCPSRRQPGRPAAAQAPRPRPTSAPDPPPQPADPEGLRGLDQALHPLPR
jgi:hypothetical protein